MPNRQELPFTPVELDEEQLYELALEHQQELAMLDESIAAAEAIVSLAESAWLPDLSIGAQLMLQEQSAMQPAPVDSGEEALAITFGLSLPLSFHANAAANSAADASLRAALFDKQAQLALLAPRLREAIFQERNAARLLTLYAEELLPRARDAVEIAEANAQNDSGAYAELLEASAAYYSFSLAYERARADHFQSVARLERILGVSLVPQAEEALP